MDINMPEMGGLEATRQIVAGHPGTIVFLCSTTTSTICRKMPGPAAPGPTCTRSISARIPSAGSGTSATPAASPAEPLSVERNRVPYSRNCDQFKLPNSDGAKTNRHVDKSEPELGVAHVESRTASGLPHASSRRAAHRHLRHLPHDRRSRRGVASRKKGKARLATRS